MRIEFDHAKDAANCRKHGVSFALAAELDWDNALVWLDSRFGDDELRMRALAPSGDTLYFVAFVERGESLRIISMRRVTRREAKYYVENC